MNYIIAVGGWENPTHFICMSNSTDFSHRHEHTNKNLPHGCDTIAGSRSIFNVLQFTLKCSLPQIYKVKLPIKVLASTGSHLPSASYKYGRMKMHFPCKLKLFLWLQYLYPQEKKSVWGGWINKYSNHILLKAEIWFQHQLCFFLFNFFS